MNGLRTNRRRRPELPLVPLIDVLVMLVLFAFVTMRFQLVQQTLNITLPKVETAGKNEFKGNVTISVDKAGAITLNGKLISDEQLDAALKQLHNIDHEIPVLIKADEDSMLKKVTFVWDVCRKNGMTHISLQSR
ncbi:MAG TPA: biopolymer transporter ExbD [Opitutaceae bacterium]|nr:biopolymer transporter ExbD [Opitutaceae bacterium]